jgi:adenylate cyclase
MRKSSLIHFKNEMFGANFLANFIAVFLVSEFLVRAEPIPDKILNNPVFYWADAFFTPVAFIFVAVTTLIYEQPIRRYLNIKFRKQLIPEDLGNKAQRRLLNEPFILIALDLSMWLLSAIFYSTLLWTLDGGSYLISRSLYLSLSTGFITAILAFFLLEYISQKRLAHIFFPDGGLCAISKTIRIRIRTRLVALLFALNLIPLFSILLIFYRIVEFYKDPVLALDLLHQVIISNSSVFIVGGIFLTFLVGRNLTLPFGEIIQTLQEIRNGNFENNVRVTSNDEIGYTGDVINEMTAGLKEREKIKDIFGKFVAKEVRDEVLSGRVPLDGEKKVVTVLFSDLRNFTSMTESNDPKLVIKIMNSYFREMDEAIQAQQGLVLQFIGDGIYAVFGAPVSLLNHSSRAFRAGLEMNRRLIKLNLNFKDNGWPILKHGIGIHTGEALAANIGSPERMSYTLMGDNINIASRLQSLTRAKKTNMIISAATYNGLTKTERNTAMIRHLPPTIVKGKKQPVEIFAVT